MSVITTADEKIDSAEQSVRDAAEALSDVLIHECWGSDEYTPERMIVLREVLNELISIKIRLRG